jgi:hypothetical protein
MGLSKEVVIDNITVIENGAIQVRKVTRIIEDGEIISSTYHRHVLFPADNLINEDPKVVAIAQATWTPEVITAYKDSLPVDPAIDTVIDTAEEQAS